MRASLFLYRGILPILAGAPGGSESQACNVLEIRSHFVSFRGFH